MAPTSKKCMIVDNQKNQEKEIKLILQLLNAIKAKHTLSVQEAEEGKEAVFKRVEEKLGYHCDSL